MVGALGGVAWYQRDLAETRRAVAESRQLASESRTSLEERLDLALLLSVAAYRTICVSGQSVLPHTIQTSSPASASSTGAPPTSPQCTKASAPACFSTRSALAARCPCPCVSDSKPRITSEYPTAPRTLRAQTPQKAVERVESLLDMLQTAYEKQLAVLLEDDVMDLETELEVLERTIRMEGLVEDEG